MDLGMILCYGVETIDQNLQKLVDMMETFPESTLIGTIQGWAKMIGLCIALGVGSYECYMMILGRRGMDVMKLLRIVIISLCISFSGAICQMAREPGLFLGKEAQNLALLENEKVRDLEKQVADQQKKYLDAIQAAVDNAKIQETEDNKEHVIIPVVDFDVTEFQENMRQRIQKTALLLETKICEWISIVIRYIAEIIFQVSYYGMLVAQNIFIHLLWAFCPIAFAMSLAPPFHSAWSQWLSKFISLSLWSFVVYMVLYYVNFIMQYNLELDLAHYLDLTKDASAEDLEWSNIATIGMESLGTTCMYAVGLLVGVFCLKFVPEVSSWLIPGGVSSGAGGASVGAATAGAAMAGGAVGGAVGGMSAVAPMMASEAKTVSSHLGGALGGVGQAAQDNLSGASKGIDYNVH